MRRAIRYDRNHTANDGHLTVAYINRRLTDQEIDIGSVPISRFFLGTTCQIPDELVVRQFLLLRFAGRKLNYALQVALASPETKIIYPLPKEWKRLFEGCGLKVAHRRCSALFQIKILYIWAFGILVLVRQFVAEILTLGFLNARKSKNKASSYVYFDALQPTNINRPEYDPNFDIISWYTQWAGKKKYSKILRHDCVGHKASFKHGEYTVSYQKNPVPPLEVPGRVFCFILWGLASIMFSGFKIGCGCWWYGLLFYQTPNAKLVSLAKSSNIAEQYFFSNSSFFRRQLWTYEAEKRGAQITLYFYSTNCESFKTRSGYLDAGFGYKLMNWPQYLVWDDAQRDFVQRAKVSTSGEIIVVGQIWFFDSPQSLPIYSKNLVAAFDTTPIRTSEYVRLGADNQYYTYSTVKKFFDDILQLAEEDEFELAIKPKRKPNPGSMNRYDKRYLNKIEGLSHHPLVHMFDVDTSPQKLIGCSKLVVSLPFSTTSLIAREIGLPSVYYDPNGQIFQDDRASHGVEIISDKGELQYWIKKHIMSL